MILQSTNIKKTYNLTKETSLNVLKGVSVSVSEGEIVSLVGPSGAGKSSLIHILGLLDRPTEGELVFDGMDVAKLNDEKISTVRNMNIGFVFQFHHLLPEFTALENVLMPALIAGASILQKIDQASALLDEVGVLHRKDHKPSELSGGEQQRVAVARALMNSPKIVFADEPSGNLDSENARQLHTLLFTMRKKYNQAFVVVTHNMDLASQSDRIITLKDGKIV